MEKRVTSFPATIPERRKHAAGFESQLCPHGLRHPSSKTFQKKAERSQDALILLILLLALTLPSLCFIWHRSLDCRKLAANCSEKFWGCPKPVQYKEFFESLDFTFF